MTSGGRWNVQYVVIDATKFRCRLANRKVVGNVVKEITVPYAPTFLVALGQWKPTPIEESDTDVEELEGDDKLDAEDLEEHELVISEESECNQNTWNCPPEETTNSENIMKSRTLKNNGKPRWPMKAKKNQQLMIRFLLT